MDKIHYLNNPATQQSGKFPVSIQGLGFIQKQVQQLQNLAYIAGDASYILRNSQKDSIGLALIWGEILPIVNIRSVRSTHLELVVRKETVNTDSGVYADIREIREMQWVAKPDEVGTATLIPITWLSEIKPNAFLWSKIQEIMTQLRVSLPMEIKTVTIPILDGIKEAMRVICLKGSTSIHGHTSYSIDVTPADGLTNPAVTQVLTAPNLRRYGRNYNPTTSKWTNFEPLDDEMNLEIKVIRGILFIRHGYLPADASIMVMRKRARNTNAGMGRPVRSPKHGWYNGWQMKLARDNANKWYVPKVASTDKKFLAQIGKPLGEALISLLYIEYPDPNNARRTLWRIRGVRKKWRTARRGHAQLALAVVRSNKHNVTSNVVKNFKFRVQGVPTRTSDVWANVKTFSVD